MTGDTWGLLYFQENFTKAFISNAASSGRYPHEDGQMHVYMDTTSKNEI